MHRHVRKNQSFLVVALAQGFVLAQEKLVPYAESANKNGKIESFFFGRVREIGERGKRGGDWYDEAGKVAVV